MHESFTVSLRESITSIRKLTPELNAASDQANAVVARVEKFLNDECRVGIPAEIQLKEEIASRGNQSNSVRRTYLRYARVSGGKFRIAVEFRAVGTETVGYENWNNTPSPVDEEFEVQESITPWAECARDVKLSTFPELPQLLSTLAANLDSMTKRTRGTVKTVNEILEALDLTTEILDLKTEGKELVRKAQQKVGLIARDPNA